MTSDQDFSRAIWVLAERVAAGEGDEAVPGFLKMDLTAAPGRVVQRVREAASKAVQAAENTHGVAANSFAAALLSQEMDQWTELASRDPAAAIEGLDRFNPPAGVHEFRLLAGSAAYNRAALRRDLGRYDEAEAGYRQTIDDFAGDPDPEVNFWGALALFNCATLLVEPYESREVRAEEALELLERLLTDFGESPHPGILNRVARGVRVSVEIMVALGRAADAVQRYDQLRPRYAQDDPGGPQAWDELGIQLAEVRPGPLPEEALVRSLRADLGESLAVLRAIASCPDGSADRYRLIFDQAHLLTARAVRVVTDALDGADLGEREDIRAGLQFANSVRQELDEAGGGFPLSGGSILEQLINSVNVVIAEDAALEVAGQPVVVRALSFPYVVAIWQWAVELADRGAWREALRAQRLLLTATDRLPAASDNAPMRHRAAIGYLNIARAALIEVADPRVLRSAVEVGNRLLNEAGDDTGLAVEALAGLGTLYLEPYTVGRPSETFLLSLRRWMERLHDEVPDPTIDLSAPEWRMPDVNDAFDTAESYLNRALELAADMPTVRGQILVSLLGVASGRGCIGLDTDLEAIRAMSVEAVHSLDPQRQFQLYVSALAFLAATGEKIDPAMMDSIIRQPIEDLVSQIGERAVVQALIGLAQLLRGSDPDRGLALFDAAQPLIDRADEELRHTLLRMEWDLLATPRRDVPESAGTGLNEVSAWAAAHARDEGWEQDDVNRALLRALAAEWAGYDNDEAEVKAMALWEETASRLGRDRPQLVAYVRASASADVSNRAIQREDWTAAARWLLRACADFLDVHGLDAAAEGLNLLEYTCDKSGRGEIVRPVLNALLPIVVALEDRLGPAGRTTLQRIYSTLISSILADSDIDLDALLVTLQMAKGLRMAASLQAAQTYNLGADTRGRELLDQITGMEASLAQAGNQESQNLALTSYQETVLNELNLVTGYEEALEAGTGSTAASQLANLQRTFDAHVATSLLRGLDGTPDLILSNELGSLLSTDAVLMLMHVGARLDGRKVLLILIATADQTQIVAQHLGGMDQMMAATIGGRSARVDPIQGAVFQLRRDIVEDPGPGQLSSSARQSVQSLPEEFLGPAVDLLRAHHSGGKQRLIIVPHGALHFMPLHLFHIDGAPMAERFAVTYLPNLAFLRRSRGHSMPDRPARPIASFGLGFETFPHPDELTAIPQAAEEASHISAVFGAEPVLDSAATSTAVLNGLRSSQRVHIATHGAHNVAAPSFQRIFLAPDPERDDQLAAYELLQLDLQGLDLVTLSACETALGRFDPSDNLRGIPASLLLRGTAAVIGTMWPVETGASQAFFGRLYENLHEGMARVEAFAQAQRHVRQHHPQYRDWGAFMYLGT
jgi:CHAT domain-containing protein/tetratricopeptide (TPR) repeat protein